MIPPFAALARGFRSYLGLGVSWRPVEIVPDVRSIRPPDQYQDPASKDGVVEVTGHSRLRTQMRP